MTLPSASLLPMPDIIIASLVVLLATSIGALSILFLKTDDGRKSIIVLAFAAGIMSFSVFELLFYAFNSPASLQLAISFFAGVAVVMVGERLIPHVHSIVRKKEMAKSKKKTALVVGAIAIHNIPEGLAIASAFLHSSQLGWLITLAIALQDIPEGFMVAAPAYVYGMRKRLSIFLGLLSGFFESLAALTSYFFLLTLSSLSDLALAFSGGAMATVILFEILPDALSNPKYVMDAALSFFFGILVATSFFLFFS